jgi:signal peptidase I
MEPTVHVGDRVVVLKAAYDLRLPFSDVVVAAFDAPQRGDVVVLDSPEQDMLLLKRVVAVAGDRVAIRDGEVWIDDERYAIRTPGGEVIENLGQRHTLSMDRGGGPDLAETIVPDDHFLVLGDHRGDSRDGRSFGMISRSAIRGRAAAVYFSDGALRWRGL